MSIPKEISPEYSLEDWCCSWNSNSLVTWGKDLTHWKRPQCWARLKAGGEGDDRGWDGWMASPTRWTWVWASSGSWWWTGQPGVLQSMGSQRVRHDWVTEQNWIHKCWVLNKCTFKGGWLRGLGFLGGDFAFCTHRPLWAMSHPRHWATSRAIAAAGA